MAYMDSSKRNKAKILFKVKVQNTSLLNAYQEVLLESENSLTSQFVSLLFPQKEDITDTEAFIDYTTVIMNSSFEDAQFFKDTLLKHSSIDEDSFMNVLSDVDSRFSYWNSLDVLELPSTAARAPAGYHTGQINIPKNIAENIRLHGLGITILTHKGDDYPDWKYSKYHS